MSGVKQEYGNMVICYVHGILIATRTLEEHSVRLGEVLDAIHRAGLKCKPEKCSILMKSIIYLGRTVEGGVMRPDPEAIRPVLEWKPPRNLKEMQSFWDSPTTIVTSYRKPQRRLKP